MSHLISKPPTEETQPSAYELAHARQLIEQVGTQSELAEADTQRLWQLLWQQIQRGYRTLYHMRQWLQERQLALTRTTYLSRSEWLAMAMAAGLMVGSLGQPLMAQAQEPVGSEFQVNTHTTASQFLPDVAMDLNGNFVVTWSSNDQDGSDSGIYAQRYNASGTPQGNEFRVNTYTTNSQEFPSIAMNQAGDFIIAWESEGQDGSDAGIYAQRYNASGTPQGNEFRVNTYTTNRQRRPNVAMNQDGDFVITWKSLNQYDTIYGVYAQRYNVSGTPQDSEFHVNTFTARHQTNPDVAIDQNGNFVITWASGDSSSTQDGSKTGVFARRYNASGVAQTDEFQVNSYTTGDQGSFSFDQSIAMDQDGDFVITWLSQEQDGSLLGTYAQRYNATGVPQGDEFLINTYTTRNQYSASIAMDSAGNFVVVWQSDSQDNSNTGVYAQRYNTLGAPQGSEFLINTTTAGPQGSPSIDMNADGNFVVVWQGAGPGDSIVDIFAQQYGVPSTPEILVSGNGLEIMDDDTTPTIMDHTDFGDVLLSSANLTRTFTISNTGNAELTLNNVTLSGSHASDFSITQQPTSPIVGNSSITFEITFTPSATGTRTAEVSLTNNDSDENPYNFTIQGTGVDEQKIYFPLIIK